MATGNIEIFSKLKTWVPKIYDLNTYKRDAPEQKWIQVGHLGIAFLNSMDIDFSGIDTMLQIRNLPFEAIGGTIFIGDFKVDQVSSSLNSRVALQIQQAGKIVYPRDNVVSSQLNNPAHTQRVNMIFIGIVS